MIYCRRCVNSWCISCKHSKALFCIKGKSLKSYDNICQIQRLQSSYLLILDKLIHLWYDLYTFFLISNKDFRIWNNDMALNAQRNHLVGMWLQIWLHPLCWRGLEKIKLCPALAEPDIWPLISQSRRAQGKWIPLYIILFLFPVIQHWSNVRGFSCPRFAAVT